ncbi:MAG: hypothetical protein ACTS6P_01540 [Candidatus Hodgkinia cicadicola]
MKEWGLCLMTFDAKFTNIPSKVMFHPSSVEASEVPCNSTEIAFHLSTIQRSINLRPSAGANLRRAEVLTST